MESLFTRVYRYRQRENKNELENFCIEILAFCLEIDADFQNDFLDLIGVELIDEVSISTQQHYGEIGRPDIELVSEKLHVIIECKIDSDEGENQLVKYLKAFETKRKQKKHLVYLTKFYQHKSITQKGVEFLNLSWADIDSLLWDRKNPVLIEFSTFLNEKNIAMDKNFNTIDLVSLENISNTISKMDEVLDSVKEYFSKSFGNPSKDSSRSTQLKHNGYYNFKNIGDPYKFHIDLGFYWGWGDNIIYLEVSIRFLRSLSSSEELIKFFKHELLPLEWEYEEQNGYDVLGKYLNVNELISTGEEQIPEMIKFLTERIDELKELKKKYPHNFS
jgi:hypothetical protein